ncbi:MAG: MarR family transcriptional regulator [Oscillospiraceae bacterium]|nr:MarR family transcriptional regulator [Oscillospiraceae bacterium]
MITLPRGLETARASDAPDKASMEDYAGINPIDLQIIEQIRQLFSITKQLPPLSGMYILSEVAKREQVSQQHLAQALHMKPQSISEHLKKMEAKELIVRQPSTEDRRITLVSITDAGREDLKSSAERMHIYSDTFVSALAPAEKEQLNALLEKIIR